MAQPPNAAWQEVKCADCGKQYVCTPEQDYYNNVESLEDGVCWDCLLKAKAPHLAGQTEPPYKHL